MKILYLYLQRNMKKKNLYLVCNKRGSLNGKCQGKAKYIKKSGLLIIYEKCINTKNNHSSITYENFKEMYYNNNFSNINFNLSLMQKYFIQCLIENNKVINFIDSKYQFNKRFPNKEYLISEETFKKLKSKILGNVKNISIEEI